MRRRSLPLLRPVLALALALVVVAVAGLFLVRIERVVTARGRLVGASVAVTAPREGRVAAVLVEDGASVDRGAVLLRLEDDDLAATARELEVRIDGLEARERDLRRRAERMERELFPAERAAAAQAVTRAEVALRRVEARARATERLGQEGLAGSLDVEQARLAREEARAALEEARRTLAVLPRRQRLRLDEVRAQADALAAEIDEARARLAAVRADLERSAIEAPVAGRIACPRCEELPGRWLAAGEEVLRIVGGEVTAFEAPLPDRGRARVRPGQEVRIRLDAWPWMLHGTLHGRVVRIGPVRGPEGFPVRIEIDRNSSPGPLYEGMTGEARIVVGDRIPVGRLLLERLAGTGSP